MVIAALVIGVGYGFAKPAASSASSAGASATQSTTTAISSATVVCPLVKDSGSTNITTFSPNTLTTSGTSTETVSQLSGSSSLLTAGKAGTLSTATGVSGATGSALTSASTQDISNPVIAKAAGSYAPGFTVTETAPSGSTPSDKGLASENCTSPDTEFWFAGLGTDSSPYAMLNLVNTDNVAASVTITMYTAGGELATSEATALQGLTIQAGSQQSELVVATRSTSQKQGAPCAMHVVVTAGRVAASVLDWDGSGNGRDFIGSQKSATTLVFPGIPQAEDNEKVQLSLLSPNGAASVALRWVGHSTISPAVSAEFSGNLVQDKVSTVDLSQVPTAGENAALEVCGSNSAAGQCLPVTANGTAVPIVGEVKITQSDGNGQDTAYTNPVQALSGDGIVAENSSSLPNVVTLTNTGSQTAQVKLTETGSGDNPTPVTTTVSVPAGQTVGTTLTAPKGASSYALTVTPEGGAQDVYAARIEGTGSQITIQPLTTASESVTIPAVGQDTSGLVPQN